MTPKDYLQKAIDIAGTQAKLAQKCGISQTAIHKMLKREGNIPLERAYQIEKATDGQVTKEQLRPDIYQEKLQPPIPSSIPETITQLNQ